MTSTKPPPGKSAEIPSGTGIVEPPEGSPLPADRPGVAYQPAQVGRGYVIGGQGPAASQ
jgi:hypothetical protein